MKKTSKILVSIFSFWNLLYIYSISFAGTGSIDTGSINKKLFGFNTNNGIYNAAAYITGYIVWAGIAIAVGVLMYKGIKFIIAAPAGKADIKKELIPWSIGVVILLTFQGVLQLIINFSQTNINTL